MDKKRRLWAILTLTNKIGDLSYWRATMNEGWRRLRTQEDYDRLNAAVDRLSAVQL